MKKRIFSILLSLCLVLVLFPVTAFAEEPTITINGPYEICAQQDYEFTVTAADGVTIVNSMYGNDYIGDNVELTPNKDGVLSGVVPASSYSMFEGSFTLSVSGTVEGQTTGVFDTKNIQIVPNHIFVDGVCGCGEKQQYIVEYDGGAEFGLKVDVKTHGVDLTLPGETFHREGYVQTGWMSSDGVFYDLGGVYSANADVTLRPVWDEIITLTVPFTTTVTLGDSESPGKTVFTLEIVDANAGEDSYADMTVSASVTTNGAGSYDGTMTITGPFDQIRNMLCEGAFVKQVDAGEANWAYDDTVWGLLWQDVVAFASTDDAAPAYSVLIFPATCGETENGMYYDLDWDADPVERMSFTNTYTKSAAKPGIPGTGDNSNFALWFALLAISAAGVIGTGVYSKRRRSSRAK